MSRGAVLEDVAAAVRDADLFRRHGRVCDLIGLIVEATGLEVSEEVRRREHLVVHRSEANMLDPVDGTRERAPRCVVTP